MSGALDNGDEGKEVDWLKEEYEKRRQDAEAQGEMMGVCGRQP
ncbi:hypothetical protein [Salmonella enterica]